MKRYWWSCSESQNWQNDFLPVTNKVTPFSKHSGYCWQSFYSNLYLWKEWSIANIVFFGVTKQTRRSNRCQSQLWRWCARYICTTIPCSWAIISRKKQIRSKTAIVSSSSDIFWISYCLAEFYTSTFLRLNMYPPLNPAAASLRTLWISGKDLGLAAQKTWFRNNQQIIWYF